MEGWKGIGNRNNQQQIYPGGISSVHKITKLLDSLAERLANFNELESGKSNEKLGGSRRVEIYGNGFVDLVHAPRPIYANGAEETWR